MAVADLSKPAPHPEVAVFPLDDELILYAPESAHAYVLNGTAGEIWDLCDGTRTLVSIAEALAERFDLEPAQALEDVRALIADLEQAGLLADR